MSTGVRETYNDEKAAVVDDRPIGGDVAKRTHVVALQGLYEDGAIDAVYQRKAQILNQAIQEIGMGKYQVRSLVRCEGETDD